MAIPPALMEGVLALLLSHCESDEEGVRTVVADCLGKLALRMPEALLPVRPRPPRPPRPHSNADTPKP